MSRVYVGNLGHRVTEQELEDEFREFGAIRSVWIAHKPLGYAIIDFDDPGNAEDAIRELNGKNGRRVESCKNQGGSGVCETRDELLENLNSADQLHPGDMVARSELEEKSRELEHAEQRLSSIKEKLSIAVSKGKGLVVQRDGLKQSLAEKSMELEKCSDELKLKDARIEELETKLKTYQEAGERVESLEFELSYIRNSAASLRESFLLKDSMLQRIEEILEDLDLPENFHSRDLIEKVEWLARSAINNSVQPGDSDQKSSQAPLQPVSGVTISEAWREDIQPGSYSGEDLRIKLEELQGKFYGLAEHNEMLEQSLMQQNNLVQRWEELLEKIDMPLQLRSMEVEDKIEWLGSELSEAIRGKNSLQEKACNLESGLSEAIQVRNSLQQKIENLESELSKAINDRNSLQRKLVDLESGLSETIQHRSSFQQKVENLESELCKAINERNSLQQKVEGLETGLSEAIHHKNSLQQTADKFESDLSEAIHDRSSLQQKVNYLEGGLSEASHEKSTLKQKVDNLESELSDAIQTGNSLQQKVDNLESELSEAIQFRNSLQKKVDDLENCCRALAADLEVSQKQKSDVFADLQSAVLEREQLSKRLESLIADHEQFSARINQYQVENEKLQNEVNILQQKLSEKLGNEEYLQRTVDEMIGLMGSVNNSLQEAGLHDLLLADQTLQCFEGLLRNLIDNYKAIASVQPASVNESDGNFQEALPPNNDNLNSLIADQSVVSKVDEAAASKDMLVAEELNVASLKNDLEEALDELRIVKEERDTFGEKQQILLAEIESLDKERTELQDLLRQEEQKYASVREKLEEALDELRAVKEERDIFREKQQLLLVEFESLENKRMELQNLLSQEEQNSASVREKLDKVSDELRVVKEGHMFNKKQLQLLAEVESLEKKRTELEDLLCQEEKKSASLQEKLDDVLNELRLAMEERDVLREKQQSLLAEVESVEKKRTELQNILSQEELKSASVKHKLDEALDELRLVKEERDLINERLQSLLAEVESLEKKRTELQDVLGQDKQTSASFREKLDEASEELRLVKEERDMLREEQQSLAAEVESLVKKKMELQDLLTQEEQKSASTKEKLDEASDDLRLVKEERGLLREKQHLLLADFQSAEKKRTELQNLLCQEELNSATVEQKLDEALDELRYVKEERDLINERLQSLLAEVESLEKERTELQDLLSQDGQKSASFREILDEASEELRLVKEERDMLREKQQSLLAEVETLNKKKKELEDLLTQEEQKTASVREKLNVAVRKGKSLVQQRDSLKQNIEELNNELTNMKSEINLRENTLAEYEQRIRELPSCHKKIEAIESESLSLRNRLKETEDLLQEQGNSLSLILSTLDGIKLGHEVNSSNPVEKLQHIEKVLKDLQSAVASCEKESRKSRRDVELLFAELNEVQERNDNLQEELSNYANEHEQLTRERNAAEAAKFEAFLRLEELSAAKNAEQRKHYSELMVLRARLKNLRSAFSNITNFLFPVFSKELEFLHSLAANTESYLKQSDANVIDWPRFNIPSHNSVSEDDIPSDDLECPKTNLHDSSGHNDSTEICGLLMQNMDDFMIDVSDLKQKANMHSISWHEKANRVSEIMGEFFVYTGKEKDMEITSLHEKLNVLYKVCANVFAEIESKRSELVGNKMEHINAKLNLNQSTMGECGMSVLSTESIKSVADQLQSAVQKFTSMTAEMEEGNQKEMKLTIANLQRELQEKDIQREKMCNELVNQIKEAEAATRKYSMELQTLKGRIHDSEKQLQVVVEERNSLDQRVRELHDAQASSLELQERATTLNDLVTAKEQEIEALTQALDEEEEQMEDLKNRIGDLELQLQQKNLDLDKLEASRGQIAKKLSVTVTKFDELHHLSESLLSHVEDLEAQLKDRETDVSFLRQEVIRCTNEVLAAETRNKRDSEEIQSVLSWFDTLTSLFGLQDKFSDTQSKQAHNYMEALQKKITSIFSELEDVQSVNRRKDGLLEAERSKVKELRQREEALEKTLRVKESQLSAHEDIDNPEHPIGSTSEIVEVEPVLNKYTATRATTQSQVRSLRKVNNDQVAITMDADRSPNDMKLDEDDDKAHGFKSLSTSRIVPKFTRPVTDIIDGLWVTCDRTLMRQPVLRLGIILYWAFVHTLLAMFVV